LIFAWFSWLAGWVYPSTPDYVKSRKWIVSELERDLERGSSASLSSVAVSQRCLEILALNRSQNFGNWRRTDELSRTHGTDPDVAMRAAAVLFKAKKFGLTVQAAQRGMPKATGYKKQRLQWFLDHPNGD
jgi:hypothetical protein